MPKISLTVKKRAEKSSDGKNVINEIHILQI